VGEEARRRKVSSAAPDIDAVEVAIRAVTPDGDAHMVIALALHYARLDRLPSGGQPLLHFLGGPLLAAFEATAGAPEARLRVERLGQALAPRLGEAAADPVSSGVRPAARRKARTTQPEPAGRPASPSPRLLRMPGPQPASTALFFVSNDTSAGARLADALADTIRVAPLCTAASLMEGLSKLQKGTRLVVVLDCRGSLLGDSALAMFARELPPVSHIVLWGPESKVRAQLAHAPSCRGAATEIGPEATSVEIALIVRAVLG